MSEFQLHTPLVAVADLPLQGPDVGIRELPVHGHVNLRGDPSQGGFADAVSAVSGVTLPDAANTTSALEPPCALWLGPGEWLLRLPEEADAASTVAGLDAALGGHFHAANDVSSAQTVLRLEGPRTREVLRKGCTLDVHQSVFAPGQCAQTNLAQTVVILMAVDDLGGIDVIVRRSFADYLARWLLDACR